MATTIFLLGRPGSGKSTAARAIRSYTHSIGWSTEHINDYTFLFEMFQADREQKRFRPTGCDGFDVVDFVVLDEALQQVEAEAERHLHQPNKLLLLEFARNDYSLALKQFKQSFLQDAYILFFEADIDTCVRRVYERSSHPTFMDDHFISEEMIRNYYREDDSMYRVRSHIEEYSIKAPHVHFVRNSGTHAQFSSQIRHIVKKIVEQSESRQRHTASYADLTTCAKVGMLHSPL